jgi:hypothetical protein
MMLHAKAGENLDAPIVSFDWKRHGHGAFGELEAIAIVGIDPKAIRDNIELPARHFEGWVLVNLHLRNLAAPAAEVKGERVFPASRIKDSGKDFQPED